MCNFVNMDLTRLAWHDSKRGRMTNKLTHLILFVVLFVGHGYYFDFGPFFSYEI